MTRKFEIKSETKVVETQQCVEHTCDICKRVAHWPEGTGHSQGTWAEKSRYELAHVNIKCVEGDSYPEGGTTNTTKFDICPTCFHEKVVPFLESLGAVATKERRYH